jgi:hypothetical protein
LAAVATSGHRRKKQVTPGTNGSTPTQ